MKTIKIVAAVIRVGDRIFATSTVMVNIKMAGNSPAEKLRMERHHIRRSPGR